jgi:hypothetical protein
MTSLIFCIRKDTFSNKQAELLFVTFIYHSNYISPLKDSPIGKFAAYSQFRFTRRENGLNS